MNIETTPIILKDLVLNTNALSAMITSTNGLPMFSEFKEGIDEERIAATSAAILSIAENIAFETLNTELEQIIIETKLGNIIVKSISENSLIILNIENDADKETVLENLNTTILMLNSSAEFLELV